MARNPIDAAREITIKLKRIAAGNVIFKKTDMAALGRLIVHEMKADIEDGVSPITGSGFPAYKNPKRYPGKRKPPRPVNLRLTGQFLNSLRSEALKGTMIGATIFLSNRLAKLKEHGHRHRANRQPKRPIMLIKRERLRKGIRDKAKLFIRQLLDKAKRR